MGTFGCDLRLGAIRGAGTRRPGPQSQFPRLGSENLSETTRPLLRRFVGGITHDKVPSSESGKFSSRLSTLVAVGYRSVLRRVYFEPLSKDLNPTCEGIATSIKAVLNVGRTQLKLMFQARGADPVLICSSEEPIETFIAIRCRRA
jgi:hypothetical protein